MSGWLRFFLAFAFGYSACAYPQTADSSTGADAFQEIARRMLREARQLVVPTLSSDEREREHSIDYLVISSGDVNAFAYRENGQRNIRLSGGSVQMFMFLAEADVVAGETGDKKCAEAYMTYVGERIFENSARRRAGATPQRTYNLVNAARREVVPECPKSKVETYQSVIAQNRQFVGKEVAASFAVLWLHEVAHHCLNHVDDPNASQAVRRQREIRADAWAVQRFTEANQFASVARPFLYLLAVTQGMNLEQEKDADHPNGQRRVEAIAKVMKRSVKDNPTLVRLLEASHRESEYFDALDALRIQANSLIPNE